MEKLDEMDIVKIHMMSNSKHHMIMGGNTCDLEIPENSFMSTSQFEENEVGIDQLHTDRLDDIRPVQYKTNCVKTNLQKYFSTRHHREVEEIMGNDDYQILINDTANLIKGRFNHGSIQSLD